MDVLEVQAAPLAWELPGHPETPARARINRW